MAETKHTPGQVYSVGVVDRGHGRIGPFAVLGSDGRPVAENIPTPDLAAMFAAAPAMYEAMRKIANGREKRMPDGTTEVVDLDDPAEIASAALSSAVAKDGEPT